MLFADLVGFTPRAESLDPEDVKALLSPYYARLREELERFGGTVEKFIGDAVMALFGAPVAHEDDPERAVRAALAIRDWVREQEEGLQVRIAVTTGEALVSLGARPSEGEGMASGDVVNTAARLQAAAPVDGILVGKPTYRATRDAIEYREAEPVQAKGKSGPIRVWEALEARSRVAVERGHDAPLVGRDAEVGFVVDALERAKRDGSPQLITVVGVPGIGKSRLVYELFRAIERSGELTTWRQGRALPYGEGVSFWPLAEMVKAHAGVLETDSAEHVEDKLSRAIEPLGLADPDWVKSHLRPLAGLTGMGEARGDRRDEAFTAWRRFFEGLAEQRPLVLVFEDLHWADEGLLDFVDHLVEWASGVPILVLCTTRPELLSRRPGWGGGKPNAGSLSLSPLSDGETARLLASLTGKTLLPAETQELLLAAAGGNPLYAEQYARMLAERGGEDVAVPENVQGIIAARLDALPGEEKALLQDAAVIGRTFWLGALPALSGGERRHAEQLLHALERKEFVRRERHSVVGGDTEYSFRHGLVWDVAYGQIPRAGRADKHVRSAEWIESLGRPDDQAELLAHHWLAAIELRRSAGDDSAELQPRARHALRAAGDRAATLYAWGAAGDYYAQALELDPDPDERADLLFARGHTLFRAGDDRQLDALEQAVEAQLALGANERAAEAEAFLGEAWWLRGSQEEAFTHVSRALGLIGGASPSPAKARVLAMVSRRQLLAGLEKEAIPAATEAFELAQRLGIAELEAAALNTLGMARWNNGDPRGIADLERSVEIGLAAGAPDVASSMNNLGVVVEESGDFLRSIEVFEETARVAERLGNRQQVRWQQGSRVWFDYHGGRWDDALELADRFIAECEAGSPHMMEINVRAQRASIRLGRGDLQGAVADIEHALAFARRAESALLTRALGTAAWIYVETGQPREARRVARQLIANIAEQTRRDFEGARDLALVASRIDVEAELLEQMVARGWTPWDKAVVALLEGDAIAAADGYAAIGATALEAHTRLIAAEQLIAAGRRKEGERELSRALVFFRSVGATYYLDRGEALLAASA